MLSRTRALLGSIKIELLFFLFLFICGQCNAIAFVDDYGMLPEHRDVVLSPDGRHYAAVTRVGRVESIIVVNIESGKLVALSNRSTF